VIFFRIFGALFVSFYAYRPSPFRDAVLSRNGVRRIGGRDREFEPCVQLIMWN